jgi:adenosylmethionine-8-amino-7-oxononanoate aminotransferase
MTDALLHPFSAPAKAETDYIKIVRAEGSTLWDDTGRTYIDAIASLWYCQVGHGRPDMHEAINAQMTSLTTYNTFDPFTNEAAARCAELIIERSPLPGGRVFLGCSGSEAVDTVLKIARLTHQLQGDHDRQVVVRRTHGYHGTNFGGTSAQGIAHNRENWGDLVPHFIEVPHDDIEAMATTFARHGERIAAVITEPVQGAGGVLLPPDGYLEQTRRLCDDHGALLVFDEVICGFGRTGSWFGGQTFGVAPDLMTFAKGVSSGYLPLSGVAVSAAVCEVLVGMEGPLRTGYTYSGHPTCAAAGVKNIEILTDEKLVDRANHIGSLIGPGLAALAADGLIESRRGVGAIWAAELGRDCMPARTELLARGIVVRPIGSSLALCPPLVITDDEVATILDQMADVLATH